MEIKPNKESGQNKIEFTDEDFDISNACKFCGGQTEIREVFLKQPLIHYVKCRNCSAVSFDKIIRQEKLDKIYSSYHYFDGSASSEEKSHITFEGVERFSRHLEKYVRKYNEYTGGVLNFGFRWRRRGTFLFPCEIAAYGW